MSVLKIKNLATGEWEEIPTIVGPPGPKGDKYTLTEDDKNELVELVLASIPFGEEVEY